MSDQILNITIQNKIINFVKKNLKKIIFLLIFLILTLFSYFVYADLKKKMI